MSMPRQQAEKKRAGRDNGSLVLGSSDDARLLLGGVDPGIYAQVVVLRRVCGGQSAAG